MLATAKAGVAAEIHVVKVFKKIAPFGAGSWCVLQRFVGIVFSGQKFVLVFLVQRLSACPTDSANLIKDQV